MSFWQILGIEATTDLPAIKKAYAARLKHTRPDDNAAAYQSLREAYDLALQHARRPATGDPQMPSTAAVEQVSSARPAQQEQEPAPLSEPVPGPGTQPPPGNTDAAEPQAQEAAFIPPRDLAHETLNYLKQAGPDALLNGWPNLRRELDKLPLSQRPDACNWFAQLVIEVPELPPAFARALSEYFAWETDFRAWQWMGQARATALREQLDQLESRFYPDPAFRQYYGQIALFGQLVQQLAKWRIYLLAMLAPSRLARLWNELSPGQRYALGVPKPPLHSLADHAMEMGCAFRTALVVFLSSVLMSWGEYAHEPWWVRLMAVLLIGYGTFVMAGYAYRGVLHVKHAQHAALWKGRLSRNRMLAMVWTAVALMVTATAIFGIWEARMWPVLFTSVDSTPLLFVAVMLVLVAYWLALLPASPAGKALPPLLLWCALAVQALPWFKGMPWTGALAGATWFLVCAIAYTLHGDRMEQAWHGFRQSVVLRKQQRRSSSLQEILVLSLALLRRTIALPYRLMVLGSEQSPHFLAAVLCMSMVAIVPEYRAWQIPLTACAMAAVSLFSSLCFDNAATALIPDQPKSAWRGWLGLAMLGLWLIWAGMYWRDPAAIHALLGGAPQKEAAGSPFLDAIVFYLVPLLPVFLNQGWFQFQRIKPANT